MKAVHLRRTAKRCGVLFALFCLVFSPLAFAQSQFFFDPSDTNVRPVRITSPANYATFYAPVDVAIFAYVHVVDVAQGVGVSFTNVEFYAGTNDLGSGFDLGSTHAGLKPGYANFVIAKPVPRLGSLYCLSLIHIYDPFGEAEIVAKFIQGNSTPADRMAVIGSEPEIYFLARRHSATGYVYTYALMEPQPFARRMQGEMIGEVEASVPEFIVYAANPFSWARQPDSDQRIFEWWNSYQTNYIRVALSDVVSHADSEFRFGIEDAGRYGKIRGLGLEVFQRKSGANHP